MHCCFLQMRPANSLLRYCWALHYHGLQLSSVFLKLILFLFSEVGSCYVAYAGFPGARIHMNAPYLFFPKLLVLTPRNCHFLAYG